MSKASSTSPLLNPQGARVHGFKAPTKEEAQHDFLWRIERQAPNKGEVVIFNRSQYEDVLVVRVHKLVPEEVWKGRYELINDFEKNLYEKGTHILKFFLHINAAVQNELRQGIRAVPRAGRPESFTFQMALGTFLPYIVVFKY